MSTPLDYDASDDGARSYLAAIEAKRLRGDDYYLRQPDDLGVDDEYERSELEWVRESGLAVATRHSDWRVIIGLFALLVAAIGAFVWWVLG